MAAVAWSTAVLLIVLLPGFASIWGASSAEPFSRDTTPRNPLGQFGRSVFFSLLVHAFLIAICARISLWGLIQPVDLKLALNALLAVSTPNHIDNLAANLGSNSLRIFGYALASVVFGFVSGSSLANLAIRRTSNAPFLGLSPASLVSEYAWLYPTLLSTTKPASYLYVYVLTSTSHEGTHLMYRGGLAGFGFRADGRFSYVVLAGPMKYLINLATGLSTSEPATIEGTGVGTPILHIDGDSIVNVFMGRKMLTGDVITSTSIKKIDRALGTVTVVEPVPLPETHKQDSQQ